METTLYNRFINVSVGQSNQTGKEIKDLKFTFKIEKFFESTPNNLNLSIYNLSKDTYDFIKKGMILIIDAGYQEDHGVIFTGNIDKVTTTKQKPDVITTLESKDGLKSLINTYVFKTFAANTSVSTIINYLISEMGFSKGTLSGIPLDKKILNGVSLAGSAKSYMDKYSKSYNFKWFVNDNFIHVLKPNETVNNQAILLNSKSGLLSGLEPTEKGFKVRSLLRWSLNPGNYVKIETSKENDFFKVLNVTHSGDSRANDWFSEMELVKI